MQAGQTRPTGSELIGDVPWGTHLCLFYQTKEALADILVPYFQAGLEHNECCIWVTSEPLHVEDAKAALHSAVGNLDDHLQNGQIEILDYKQWYTRSGAFQADAVLQGWIEKEDQALSRGFDGLRISGNTSWIEEQDWQAFTAYEAAIDSVIGQHRMIAICTYWLDRCGAAEIVDVVSNHQFALIQRQRTWRIIESTEHRRMEAALREPRQELRIRNRIAQIFLTVPDEEVFAEVLQVVLEASSSRYGTFGYVAQDGTLVLPSMTREVWGECQVPDKQITFPPEQWGGIWADALLQKRTFCSNHPGRVPDGHIPIQRSVATPLVHQAEVIGLLHVANKPTDYTPEDLRLLETIAGHIAPILHARLQRDREETAGRRAQEKIESLSRFPSENPDPVLRVAADGTLLYANAAAEPLLSEIGCGLGGVLSGECRELSENALQSGSKCRTDIRHDGRVFSFDVVPVSGAGYVNWYGRDITEVRRVKEGRERLVAELAAKNAELERFTYTVSHELKSPLITIQGYLGCLEQDAAAGKLERMKEDTARIRAAAGRMRRLLDELLELSRIGRVSDPPQETSLGELAREAVDLLAGPIAQRGAQVEIAADLPVVLADRRRLLEVLQNLIENAVKFLGDQPHPRIEIGARHDAQTADQTVCYVRDNGLGIDPRYHQRVFELFDKLDPQSEGAGVGLALVKRIVEVHGGRIWIESQGHGQGCTFCFTLPRHPGATDHDN